MMQNHMENLVQLKAENKIVAAKKSNIVKA